MSWFGNNLLTNCFLQLLAVLLHDDSPVGDLPIAKLNSTPAHASLYAEDCGLDKQENVCNSHPDGFFVEAINVLFVLSCNATLRTTVRYAILVGSPCLMISHVLYFAAPQSD